MLALHVLQTVKMHWSILERLVNESQQLGTQLEVETADGGGC